MPNDIFSGLEELGFEDVDDVYLYKKEEDEKIYGELHKNIAQYAKHHSRLKLSKAQHIEF